MKKSCIHIALLFATISPVVAQQTIKILTPTDDSCAAFITAMEKGDPAKVAALGGWALGFLSGVAQGANVDILRGATAQGVMSRVYSACKQYPGRSMSITLEEMARSIVDRRH